MAVLMFAAAKKSSVDEIFADGEMCDRSGLSQGRH